MTGSFLFLADGEVGIYGGRSAAIACGFLLYETSPYRAPVMAIWARCCLIGLCCLSDPVSERRYNLFRRRDQHRY